MGGTIVNRPICLVCRASADHHADAPCPICGAFVCSEECAEKHCVQHFGHEIGGVIVSEADAQLAAERNCQRCSECEGQQHHFIENNEISGLDDPEFTCKHCPATAFLCVGCDKLLFPPPADEMLCADCKAENLN